MESLKCRYLTLLLAMLTSVAAFADGFTLKGKVIDVVQTGYTLNGKVIRYAKVVVGA